jgi:fanconi anemia group J protein
LTTYKEVETFTFQDEVGRLIFDVCKTMPYGILCFFPSYSLLKKLIKRWDENGMANKIKEYKKIFSETDFSERLLNDYYKCIDNAKGKLNFSDFFSMH